MWLDPPCPYCGCKWVGEYGYPHRCKEVLWQSMPLLRFERFEVKKSFEPDPVPWFIRIRSTTWSPRTRKLSSSVLTPTFQALDQRSLMQFTSNDQYSFGQSVLEASARLSKLSE